MQPKISVVINVHNESHVLRDCLLSLSGFADEIIVCDMRSEDGSADIAKSIGCYVYTHEPAPYGEYTLPTSIRKASGEWILWFDPDMRLPVETAERLKQLVNSEEADVVQFHLKNRVFGTFVSHGHGSGVVFTKFFKKSIFIQNDDIPFRIHSYVNDVLTQSDARWLKLDKKYFLIHLAYDDLFDCFQKHLRYAKEEAKERFSQGARFKYSALFWEPARKFLLDVFYRAAWKGGMPALVFSFVSHLMLVQVHLFLWQHERDALKK